MGTREADQVVDIGTRSGSDIVSAYVDIARKEKRTIHAVGDGTFIVDGRKIDGRKLTRSKLPAGV